MLPKWSWLWGHSLEHGQTSRGPTLKENQFSLSQQLSTVHISSDGTELHARFPLHAGTLSGLVFSRSCEMCHNHYEFIVQLPCSVWKALFHLVVHLLWLLQAFCPLFCSDTRALWLGGVIWMVQLNKHEHSAVSYNLQLWILVSITICSQSLLWWGLRAALFYVYGNKFLGIRLILCSFSKNNRSRPVTYRATWPCIIRPNNRAIYGFHLKEWAFVAIRKCLINTITLVAFLHHCSHMPGKSLL